MQTSDAPKPLLPVLTRLGHLGAMLAGTAFLVLAATRPPVLNNGTLKPADTWYVYAAVFAGVATLLSLWYVVRQRRGGWRSGAFLIGLSALGGVLAYLEIPDVAPGIGIGLAGPWALAGYGLLAVAGLLLALPASRTEVAFRAKGYRPPVAVGAVVLVVAGLVTFGVPAAVGAANTDATTYGGPAPQASEFRLDGSTGWRADARSLTETGSDIDSIGTAGGILVATMKGVRMLGPDGEERWHHYGYDVSYDQYGVSYERGGETSDEFRVPNMVTGLDGRLAAVNTARLTDFTEDDTLTWVFDTVSGELLGEYEGDRAVAIAGGLVLSTSETYESENGTDGRIVARTPSGDEVWQHPIPEDCELGEAYDAPRELLVAKVRCEGENSPRVVALGTATGEVAWRWEPPEAGVVTVRPDHSRERGRLLVHFRPGGVSEHEQSVYLLDAASGEVRWQREGMTLQPRPVPPKSGDRDGMRSTVAWAGDTPVIAETQLAFEGRLVARAFDAKDGSTKWTRVLPPGFVPRTAGGTGFRRLVLGLPDGRLVLAQAVRPADYREDPEPVLYVLDQARGTVLQEFAVENRSWLHFGAWLLHTPATLALAGDREIITLR